MTIALVESNTSQRWVSVKSSWLLVGKRRWTDWTDVYCR